MRRSPLVTALLVLYPIAIAVLIGFALSGGPDKPRVAFLNEVPADTPLQIGGTDFDLVGAKSELCERIECVPVSSEEEARQKVESGDVLGALILPADLVDRLQTLAGLNPESPTVKVLVNEEDPVKAGLVDDRINALLSEANLKISQEVSERLDPVPADPARRRRLQLPRRRRLDPRPPQLRADPDEGPRPAPQGQPRPRGPRPRDRVQQGRRRQPRRRRRPAHLGDPADQGRHRGRQRRHSQPRHVRDLGRGDDHADVRNRAARRRLAGARAGGERLRPAHPRTRLQVGRCSPRRSCSASSSRSSSPC